MSFYVYDPDLGEGYEKNLAQWAESNLPKPGDAVILDGEYWGARQGQIAIIDGAHYQFLSPQQAMIVFAYSAYRETINGIESVSCSGGPAPFIDAIVD